LDLEPGVDFNAYDADLTTYAGITPSADIQLLLACANEAAIRTLLDLEPGTDFHAYDAQLADLAANLTASAAELNILDGVTGVTAAELSYIGDVTGLIQAQLDLKAPLDAPAFTTSIGIGSAVLSESELESIDGILASTIQLNYLKDATGTTGTTSTNLVFSTSPIFVTPTLGAATATSLTIDASATPGWVFRDSDNLGADKEIGKIYSNATTTTDGAEDGEVHIQIMDSGSEKTVIQAEGTIAAEFVDLGPPDCTYDVRTYLSVSAVDGQYSGTITTMTVDAGQTSVFGQALHVDTDGELIVADADVAGAGSAPCICLAVEAGVGAKKVLLHGIITEVDWNWTIGGLIYLGDDPTTTEGLTQTAPSTTGDQVQVLAVALSADTILFNPSLVLVEVP